MPCKQKPEVEGYCKPPEMARRLGVTNQHMQTLKNDGVIELETTDAGKRYNIEETTRRYIAYLRDKAAGRLGSDMKELEQQKTQAEVDFKRARAKMAELELAEFQGSLHRSEDVQAITEELVYTIRDSLTALPGRLAMEVAAVSSPAECAEVIRREVNLLMLELSEYQYDPAKYEARVRERKKLEVLDDDG